MQVIHPHARRDSQAPSRVNVGGNTHRLDGGVADVPEDIGEQLVDAWAEAYDTDPDDLVYEEGGPPDETAALDEMTYEQLYDAATEQDVGGRSGMDKAELIAALRED